MSPDGELLRCADLRAPAAEAELQQESQVICMHTSGSNSGTVNLTLQILCGFLVAKLLDSVTYTVCI